MERIGGEDRSVPMGGREPAELGLDLIRTDPRGCQHRGALHQPGQRRGRGRAGGAALAIEADALDRTFPDEQRDPDEVAARSAARRAREASFGLGPAPGVVR